MKPLGLTANALAKAIGVPMATVHFFEMTGALLAGWMAVRAKAQRFPNVVNATDLLSGLPPGSVGYPE